jgi:hypothetical protein
MRLGYAERRAIPSLRILCCRVDRFMVCAPQEYLWIPSHVMLHLAQSVPRNGHLTANMAVLPQQFD